jgi:hypothetical protein
MDWGRSYLVDGEVMSSREDLIGMLHKGPGVCALARHTDNPVRHIGVDINVDGQS